MDNKKFTCFFNIGLIYDQSEDSLSNVCQSDTSLTYVVHCAASLTPLSPSPLPPPSWRSTATTWPG